MRTLLRGFIPLLRNLRPLPGLVPHLPRAKYSDQVRHPLVLSGFLSWLGFSQQSEPENDLLITIKRGILAVQVHRYLSTCLHIPSMDRPELCQV